LIRRLVYFQQLRASVALDQPAPADGSQKTTAAAVDTSSRRDDAALAD
jgi:hypothetical protein